MEQQNTDMKFDEFLARWGNGATTVQAFILAFFPIAKDDMEAAIESHAHVAALVADYRHRAGGYRDSIRNSLDLATAKARLEITAAEPKLKVAEVESKVMLHPSVMGLQDKYLDAKRLNYAVENLGRSLDGRGEAIKSLVYLRRNG